VALSSSAEVVWCIVMIVATSELGWLVVSAVTVGSCRTYSLVLLFDLVFGHVESRALKCDVQLRARMNEKEREGVYKGRLKV
jgi:hypothetical protein